LFTSDCDSRLCARYGCNRATPSITPWARLSVKLSTGTCGRWAFGVLRKPLRARYTTLAAFSRASLNSASSSLMFSSKRARGSALGTASRCSDLRSVLSLYSELATVIARAGANIHVLVDLAGKRVNVGGRGTGTRVTWDAIAAEPGQSEYEQAYLTELRGSETTSALRSGTIDAGLLTVGHPSPLVSNLLTLRSRPTSASKNCYRSSRRTSRNSSTSSPLTDGYQVCRRSPPPSRRSKATEGVCHDRSWRARRAHPAAARIPAAVVDAIIAHERNAHHHGTPLGITPRTRFRYP
jgi:hypothetical protein